MSTAVWVARDGDALVVTTPEASGKVKRLRNNPRVDASTTARRRSPYGLEFRMVMGIEGLRKSGRQPRVILRITQA